MLKLVSASRKVRGVLIAVVSMLLLSVLFWFWSKSQPTASQQRLVQVGLYENEPKVYRDDEGRPAGLFVELLNEMAVHEGWQLQWQDCEWSQCLSLLENGTLELMPDVAWSEERARQFDFHDIPVTQAWSQFYTHEVSDIPRSFEELEGERISLLDGAIQESALVEIMQERRLDFEPVMADTQEEVFRLVGQGTADAGIANNFFGSRHAPRFGLVDTPVTFDQMSLFFAAPSGQQAEVLDTVDRYLLAWRLDPDSLYYSALREAMTTPPQGILPGWLRSLMLATLVLAPVLLGLVLFLRWRIQQSTRLLRQANQRLEHVMDRSPVIIYSLRGSSFTLDWISRNVERILGFLPAQAQVSGWWTRHLHEDDRPDAIRALSRVQEHGHYRHEYRIHDAAGYIHYMQDELHLVKGDPASGEEDEIVGSLTDMTDIYEQEERLSYLANFDHLTGLPNRSRFKEQLVDMLRHARINGGALCVLLVDLDRFRNVNESLGNLMGDSALIEYARRIRETLGKHEILGRFSADEFCVCLQLPRYEEALIARRLDTLLQSLRQPVSLDDQTVVMTASIGLCCFPRFGRNSEDLINMAEQAMFEAKNRGGDAYYEYHEQVQQDTFRRFQLENDLRLALEGDQLEVFYQPQVSMPAGALVGVEALVRWHHPQLGLVPPSQFVPIAENTGMIVALDQWVMQQACRQLRSWDAVGLNVPKVSVNVTAADLEGNLLLETVSNALTEYGLSAGRLEVEITESMLMKVPGQAISLLKRLSNKGVGIAMDDFGTGYSNLAFLGSIPLDRLKLDRSFTRDIGVTERNDAIIRTIFSLARSLELDIVAEGVETLAQAQMLAHLGCDVGQGYYYSKPLAAVEIEPLLRRLQGVAG